MLIEGPCTQCGKDEPIVYGFAGDDTHPAELLCSNCAKDKMDVLPGPEHEDE